MFEKYAPSAPAASVQENAALRAFGWSELTARIDAARDLRRVLRSDALVEATSFADAAGGYFVSEGHSKPAVNPTALEGRNGLSDIKVATDKKTPMATERAK
jgi:hypothetical protein